jgi:hypothetical protein
MGPVPGSFRAVILSFKKEESRNEKLQIRKI